MRHLAAIAFCGIALFTASSAIGQKENSGAAPPPDAANLCPRLLSFSFTAARNGETVGEVPIWRLPESTAFFFQAGMTIDADGAPNAYNPANTGLDDLANAGEPGHWQGVIAGEDGSPVVQGPDDPYPGYYVSCTSLSDRTKSASDPTRYVDASKIPYVVLPGDLARQAGARLGDFAVVFNPRNGKSSYAIFADVGTMGEGSIALAENLGIMSDARQGGTRRGILYFVFPGSGDGKPKPGEEIASQGARLLQDWGGAEKATACAAD